MNNHEEHQGRIIALFQQAGTCLHIGKLEEALVLCEQALQLSPQFADAHSNRGVVLRDLGRHEEALKAYERAIQLNPDFAGAHYNRGIVLQDLGRVEEALKSYERSIQLNPKYAEAHHNCGNVLLQLGHPEKALMAYEKATQLNPQYADAHCGHGVALKNLGRLEEARNAFETALRHDPELVNAKYYLASFRAKDLPPQSPQDYVTSLFDNYADRFDNDLLVNLKCRIPQLIFDAVIQHIGDKTQKIDILDLGCGTGLSGAPFSEHANQMVGVDLSPKMLAKAEERGYYTDLVQADVCNVMKQCSQKFDLILSADVFVYIGALEEAFELTTKILNPGGLFAFSIEVNESDLDYRLRLTGRYAHSLNYIRRLAITEGFEEVSNTSAALRHERGTPVAGSVIVLRMPM